MQVDWLYTIFDDQWRPSDALEDAFSVDEGFDDQLLKRLDAPSYVTTALTRSYLPVRRGI